MHRGEFLAKVVNQSSISIKELAIKLNISRTTYYNHINNKDLSIDIIAKYGRALGYNFSSEFPDIKNVSEFMIAKEPSSINEAIAEKNMWRQKYYDLLEKYNNCIEKLNAIK